MILHIDMDAFYASIEVRDNPKLRGQPVVVGGSAKGRGVVAAASYEAREFGIHSAMPAARAVRLCPSAIFIRPRMEHYAAISKQIREIFFRFTSLVEPLSLDEAFLDVAGCEQLFGPPSSIAKQLKDTIAQEVGLTASAGVAPNKFLAKLASDLQKPDGLVVVDPNAVQAFLDPLPIGRVWGVGPQTEKKFQSLGVTCIKHIRELPHDSLQRAFASSGDHFWRLARGIDTRPVVPDREAKSISHETTFEFDIEDRDLLSAWLLELTDQVASRMRRYEIKGRTVNLKVRFSDFHTITRATSIPEPSNASKRLWQLASGLLAEALPADHSPVRLLGMGVSHLSHGLMTQRQLFDRDENSKQARLDETCDEIRARFGRKLVQHGKTLEHAIRLRPDPRVDE